MNTSLYDTFWELVALAKQNHEQFLIKLKQMDRESLIHFCWTYEITAATFKYDPYINPTLGGYDEDMDEVGQWIVGQGKEYYIKILKNPSLIPTDIPGRDPALGYLSDAVREHRVRYQEYLPYPDEDFYLALEKETEQL